MHTYVIIKQLKNLEFQKLLTFYKDELEES